MMMMTTWACVSAAVDAGVVVEAESDIWEVLDDFDCDKTIDDDNGNNSVDDKKNVYVRMNFSFVLWLN